jgi:hypothetical protein
LENEISWNQRVAGDGNCQHSRADSYLKLLK